MDIARYISNIGPHAMPIYCRIGAATVPQSAEPNQQRPGFTLYRYGADHILTCRGATVPVRPGHYPSGPIRFGKIRQHPHRLQQHGPSRVRLRNIAQRPIRMPGPHRRIGLAPFHADIINQIMGIAQKMCTDIQYYRRFAQRC